MTLRPWAAEIAAAFWAAKGPPGEVVPTRPRGKRRICRCRGCGKRFSARRTAVWCSERCRNRGRR